MEDQNELIKQSQELIIKLSRALQDAQEQIKKTSELIKQKDEQLITHARLTEKGQYYDFSEIAKMLNYKGYGRNNLIHFAQAHKILRYNREPYQKYLDNGCFKSYLKPNEHKQGMAHIVPLGSIKGIEFLRELLDIEIEGENQNEQSHTKPKS